MSPRAGRLARGTAEIRRERRTRAIEFWQSAEDLHELGGDANSIVSLYVLAGIAASDAICCARLGEYAQGENHADALAVLRRAEPDLAAPLQRLLSRKTEWAYGGAGVSGSRIDSARRCHQARRGRPARLNSRSPRSRLDGWHTCSAPKASRSPSPRKTSSTM